MASSSKQSDPREMLIPLPKYSPGPHPSFWGWSIQVEGILKLSNATDQVKTVSILNAIPAGILTKVLISTNEKWFNSIYCFTYIKVLRDLREYFKNPNTEIEYYNSLQAPTKSVPF